MWSPHFFSSDSKLTIRESCFCNQWNGFGISHLSSIRWFYQDEYKDCVLMYTWKNLHCSFQLNNMVLSACVLLSPNAFFLRVFSKCYIFYTTSQSIFPTLNISTSKTDSTSDYAVISLFFLLVILIFYYLTSHAVWVYLQVMPTLLFLHSYFLKHVNKTLNKLNFRKSGLQSWKPFWTQNFC